MNGEMLNVYIESFDIQSRRCVERLENMIGKEEFDILPFIDNCTTDIIMSKFSEWVIFNLRFTSLLIIWLQTLLSDVLRWLKTMAILNW